jgi:hypothetical protein
MLFTLLSWTLDCRSALRQSRSFCIQILVARLCRSPTVRFDGDFGKDKNFPASVPTPCWPDGGLRCIACICAHGPSCLVIATFFGRVLSCGLYSLSASWVCRFLFPLPPKRIGTSNAKEKDQRWSVMRVTQRMRPPKEAASKNAARQSCGGLRSQGLKIRIVRRAPFRVALVRDEFLDLIAPSGVRPRS